MTPTFIKITDLNGTTFYVSIAHIAYFYAKDGGILIALKGGAQDEYLYDNRTITNFIAALSETSTTTVVAS